MPGPFESPEKSRWNKTETPNITTAVVTNNKDKEGLGRVKVQYPWSGKNDESHWARIATMMAGPKRGSYFLPEVDDEVLVTFINGDVEFPVIIGMLWSKADLPPETNDDGKNNIRKIRSRSGHEIVFDDSAEAKSEKLELHSAGGQKIVLDDSKGSEKILIEDQGGGKIEFDSTAKRISITSSMEIIMESNNITLKAGGVLTLQGGLVKIN